MGDIVSQSDILGELREIRAFYQEVFLVKAHWKDYYKVKIKNFLDDLLDKEGITNIIKKSKDFKIDKNLQSNNNIITGGDTIAYNTEDSPYTSTLNNIRAFNQMTV